MRTSVPFRKANNGHSEALKSRQEQSNDVVHGPVHLAN